MPTSTPDVYIEEHNVVIAPRGVNGAGWPLHWGAIWVGALAALAAVLLFGLIGLAVGTHQTGKGTVSLSEMTFAGLAFSVASAFFSFVLGGWLAATIAGTRRAETASLQGGIVWLTALPLLLFFAAIGAASFFGGWYGGLAGTPVWTSPSTVTADPETALMARNSALGAATALLIGLMGSLIGGWLASGEPMTLTYHRAKQELEHGHA